MTVRMFHHSVTDCDTCAWSFDQIEGLDLALAEALSLLRGLESIQAAQDSYFYCPVCTQGGRYPHLSDCRLAAFLAAHPGDSKET